MHQVPLLALTALVSLRSPPCSHHNAADASPFPSKPLCVPTPVIVTLMLDSRSRAAACTPSNVQGSLTCEGGGGQQVDGGVRQLPAEHERTKAECGQWVSAKW